VAHLFVTSLLELSELKYQVFVSFALVAQISFKLVDSALQVVFTISQVVDSSLVDIDQIILGQFEFFRLSVFEILDLVRVLVLKLVLDVVVGSQHAIHVLFGLFLGVQQTLLEPIHLVFHTLDLVLQIGVLTVKECFVLLQQVDFSPQPFVATLYLVLAFLELANLQLKFLLTTLETCKLVFSSANVVILFADFAALFVEQFVLRIQLFVVCLQLQVASFQSANSSLRVFLDLLQLRL
jgi:hypothetical protein